VNAGTSGGPRRSEPIAGIDTIAKQPAVVNLFAITPAAGPIGPLALGLGATEQDPTELILRRPGRGVRDGADER
jgi:hypothetical protein